MTSHAVSEDYVNKSNEIIFRRAMQLAQIPICDDPDHSLYNEYRRYIDQLTLVWGEEKLLQKIKDVKTVYAMMGVPT